MRITPAGYGDIVEAARAGYDMSELVGPGNLEDAARAAADANTTINVHLYLGMHYGDPWGWNFTTAKQLQVGLKRCCFLAAHAEAQRSSACSVPPAWRPLTRLRPAPTAQKLVDTLPDGLALEGVMVRRRRCCCCCLPAARKPPLPVRAWVRSCTPRAGAAPRQLPRRWPGSRPPFARRRCTSTASQKRTRMAWCAASSRSPAPWQSGWTRRGGACSSTGPTAPRRASQRAVVAGGGRAGLGGTLLLKLGHSRALPCDRRDRPPPPGPIPCRCCGWCPKASSACGCRKRRAMRPMLITTPESVTSRTALTRTPTRSRHQRR